MPGPSIHGVLVTDRAALFHHLACGIQTRDLVEPWTVEPCLRVVNFLIERMQYVFS